MWTVRVFGWMAVLEGTKYEALRDARDLASSVGLSAKDVTLGCLSRATAEDVAWHKAMR